MPFQLLEILKYTEDGQLSRRVACLAGRVTVFRAESAELIKSYAQALAGIENPENYDIRLDSNPFPSEQHNVIGFGLSLDYQTCRHALASIGVPEELFQKVIGEASLSGLLDAPYPELSKIQKQILRIIAACNTPHKVLILNDPFVDLSQEWTENIAKRLIEFAVQRQGIVVVCSLAKRPNFWLENEYISKVQLEKPIRPTIGFGSGQFSISKDVAELRKQLALENDRSSLREATGIERYLGSYSGKTFKIIAGCLLALIIGLLLLPKAKQQPQPIQTAKIETPTQAQQEPLDKSSSIIFNYPEEISLAILNAAENPEEVFKTRRTKPVRANTTIDSSAGNTSSNDFIPRQAELPFANEQFPQDPNINITDEQLDSLHEELFQDLESIQSLEEQEARIEDFLDKLERMDDLE